MRELTLRIRVAAYVLRRRAGGSVELLVFDHDADLPPGTHIPAGGVWPYRSHWKRQCCGKSKKSAG
ncbi:hypothetical protein GCM10010276_38500 [Streptomyces longisporus]|uniref:Uncharacterized protein n=1 Tax=Streptomyces longisporus TaxID=1948 RepID=A0ABN3M1Y9_STRLO